MSQGLDRLEQHLCVEEVNHFVKPDQAQGSLSAEELGFRFGTVPQRGQIPVVQRDKHRDQVQLILQLRSHRNVFQPTPITLLRLGGEDELDGELLAFRQ